MFNIAAPLTECAKEQQGPVIWMCKLSKFTEEHFSVAINLWAWRKYTSCWRNINNAASCGGLLN